MGLIKAVRDWIFTKTGVTINDRPLQESDQLPIVVGVLIKLAQIDGDLSVDESARIISLIKSPYQSDAAEAIQCFVDAANKTQALPSEELLTVLDKELTLPQKRDLIKMLYILMRVDNQSTTAEGKLISKIIAAMHVSDDLHAEAYKCALEARLENRSKTS